MRELAIAIANTKDVKAKSNYCNSKRDEKKIAIKRMRLSRDLIT